MANVKKIIEGVSFEWDSEKASINIKKHGISFEEAGLIFQDDSLIEIYDRDHSIDEKRIIAIGMVNEILSVVYTERYENTIRLISARKATKKEKVMYYEQFDKY